MRQPKAPPSEAQREFDAHRRLENLVDEVRAAPSYTIREEGGQFVLRIELGTGQRRVSMLSEREHETLRYLLDAAPPKIEAKEFGALAFGGQPRAWAGTYEGTPLRLYGPGNLNAEQVAPVERAVSGLLSGLDVVRKAISDRLYKTYTQSWREEGEGAVSLEDFQKSPALRLISARLHAEAPQITLEFDDAKLFGGHAIMVHADFEGKVVDVDVAG